MLISFHSRLCHKEKRTKLEKTIAMYRTVFSMKPRMASEVHVLQKLAVFFSCIVIYRSFYSALLLLAPSFRNLPFKYVYTVLL